MSKTTNNNIATIDKNLASAFLDKKGNFNAIQFDKDGNENHKLVTNKAIAENSAMMCAISQIASMVDKAQCYHLAQIKDSVVKNFGFKGVADYCETNFRQAIGDKTQVSRKRAVGKLFVQMYINPDNTTSYSYREGIPFDATISVLDLAKSLLKDENGEFIDFKKVDLDNLEEIEIAEMVQRFVDEYIEPESGESLIHLSLPVSKVRDEVKAIKGIKTDAKTDAKTETDETTDEKTKHETTRLESVKACVDRIANLLGDNERVADALATIIEVAEKTYAGENVAE